MVDRPMPFIFCASLFHFFLFKNVSEYQSNYEIGNGNLLTNGCSTFFLVYISLDGMNDIFYIKRTNYL